MASFGMLPLFAKETTTRNADAIFRKKVVPYLLDVWLDEYKKGMPKTNIVETTVTTFSYLFDIEPQRLIAAWGVSHGKFAGPRDDARMAGHPRGGGPLYHRGHAIAHTLGGQTDINLVPQLGSVNIGPFRVLEKRAVATPGALYFSYWMYGKPQDQKPTGVQQGLLAPGDAPDVRTFPN